MDERGTDFGGPMRSALDSVTERLATKYHRVFSLGTVELAVGDAWGSLVAHATVIPPFMPALVERFANDQLRAAAPL